MSSPSRSPRPCKLPLLLQIEVGPQETEYGRAIRCNAADSGPLQGIGAKGGDTGPPKMVGADGDRLETGTEEERNAETEGATTDTAGAETTALAAEATSDSDTGSEEGKEEEESLGSSGSSGAEWSGAEAEE